MTNPKPARGCEKVAKALLAIVLAFTLFQIVFPTSCFWDDVLVNRVARQSQTLRQVAGILNAIKFYESTYPALPLKNQFGAGNIPTDHHLIDILNGTDLEANPKAIAFLEGKAAKPPRGHRPARGGFIDLGKGSQSLVDPWGNNYIVRLDAEGDSEIEVHGSKSAIRARAVCRSYGEPGDRKDPGSAKQNDPQDWLTSWR